MTNIIKNVQDPCINNPLRLYNGNDMLMRHINQSL